MFNFDICLTKYFLLYFTIICANFNFSYGDVCSVCSCEKDRLDCTDRKISILPDLKNGNKTIISFENNAIIHIYRLPKLKVKHLSFAYNDISTIDDSAFKNLYDLTTLDLSNNFLIMTGLMPNIFKGNFQPEMYEPLIRLKELNLGNNMIHTLHPHVFEHTPHLEKLVLSGNPLKVIGQDMVTVFASIPFLKELNLSHTSLKTLPENIFHSPKYLEVLDLSFNFFKEIPRELESSHALRWLSLNGNPIPYIEKVVSLPFIRVLHLSKMPELIAIKNRSLSAMPALEEFYCSYNKKLIKISKDAFSTRHVDVEEEGETWPPLKVLVLNDNDLRYIESHLVARWETLSIINLQQNPWMCDCENQWLVSTLAPIIESSQPEMLSSFKCSYPVEMKDKPIVDLYHRNYEMRCLDLYNHEPEYDGKLLFNVLMLSIISTPIIMAALIYYKRKRSITAFYKKTAQTEFFNYSQLKIFPDRE